MAAGLSSRHVYAYLMGWHMGAGMAERPGWAGDFDRPGAPRQGTYGATGTPARGRGATARRQGSRGKCVLSSCFEQMGLRWEPWTKIRGSSARPAPSLAFLLRPFHHGAETARRCGHVVTSAHVPRPTGHGVGGGRAGASRPGRGPSPSVGLICSASP